MILLLLPPLLFSPLLDHQIEGVMTVDPSSFYSPLGLFLSSPSYSRVKGSQHPPFSPLRTAGTTPLTHFFPGVSFPPPLLPMSASSSLFPVSS